MIKYFLKDNFCLFTYNFSQRFGCISQRAGRISQRAGCKKTARCESRISQSDYFILMDKKINVITARPIRHRPALANVLKRAASHIY